MMPLRPCGRDRCRYCNPRPGPVRHDGEESLASLLVGAAFLFGLLAFVLFLLPVWAARP